MIWNNRGRQLDTLGVKFRDKKNIVFYGLSYRLVEVYDRISFLDTDIVCCWDKHCGERVEKITRGGICGSFADAVTLMEKKNYLLIITLADNAESKALKRKLILSGYKEEQDFMDASSFLEFYLPLYALYAHGKCYVEYVNHPTNWKCTLKCKKCAFCMPYLKHGEESLDKLNREADLLFAKVDFIYDYSVIGGEALLEQELLLGQVKYLIENYSHRFHNISFISNATVLPQDELLVFMDKHREKIDFYVSCYKNVPGWQRKFERFEEAFRKRNMSFGLIEDESWIDFGFDEGVNFDWQPEDMQRHFDLCGQHCRRLQDGKLAYCADSYNAQLAFYPEIDQQGELLDLEDPGLGKAEMVEWFYGYQEKGYLEMCRHCNGWSSKIRVPVAEQ